MRAITGGTGNTVVKTCRKLESGYGNFLQDMTYEYIHPPVPLLVLLSTLKIATRQKVRRLTVCPRMAKSHSGRHERVDSLYLSVVS